MIEFNISLTRLKNWEDFLFHRREGSVTDGNGSEEEHPGSKSGIKDEQQKDTDILDNGVLSGTGGESERISEDRENISDEGEAPLSERAASGFNDNPNVGSPKVQFEKIKEEDLLVSTLNVNDASSDSPRPEHEDDRKCRRHQKHEHKWVEIETLRSSILFLNDWSKITH